MDFGPRADRAGNPAVVPGRRAVNRVCLADAAGALEATIGAGARTPRPREAAAQGRR